MLKTSIYSYFAFGYNYHILKRDGLEHWPKDLAVKEIEDFLNNLDSLDLQVTKRIASDLSKTLESIKDYSDEKISAETSKSIKRIIEKLDPTLDAELQLRTAYTMSKKRYSLDNLLDNPYALLAKNASNSLCDTAKRDFRLACRHIALNQATAAAFHLMRALEAQVKVLYFAFKKTKRLEKPMWGPMTQQLRQKNSPKPSEKLLNHLDGMRVHFRNPTQHPEIFYDIDSAQDLLNQTITAINMISSELPEPKI